MLLVHVYIYTQLGVQGRLRAQKNNDHTQCIVNLIIHREGTAEVEEVGTMGRSQVKQGGKDKTT